MIISLRSGAGLDGLQLASSIVVFGELDWSSGIMDQVVGRLNRDGQKDQVMAIYLTSSQGTDELMMDILGVKASQLQGINNPNEDVLMNVSDDERIKKLAQNILNKKVAIKL